MKTNLLFFAALLVCSTSVLLSCDDDDNYTPENVVVSNFNSIYPNATRIEWEDKAGYKVADFYIDKKEMEAWFDFDGKWLMTETDILFTELPQIIQTSFKEGIYGSWRLDDVDKLERENTATMYVIEVEQGNQELDLYYSEDGTLVKIVTEGGGLVHEPIVIPESVINTLRQMYPNMNILEFERKGSFIEIDILDGKIHKEVLFSNSYEWASTEWDIRVADVPTVVTNALKASQYGNYRIDDVEILEKPTGLFYVFELESGNQEVYLTISAEGEIVTK